MEQGVILRVLVLALCSSVGHGASLDACMMVLLSEEVHTTCSTLGRNHTRPCLVQSEEDVDALKTAKVIKARMLVSMNKICAARTEPGETDCVSVHLKCNPQQNWQWAEWTGTSPNIARRFTVTEGNNNRLCPFEERYFVPEKFSSCLDAYNKGVRASGIYTISPDGATEILVYCEQELQGGGWTVIQRRQDGLTNFMRTWVEYKTGFGDLEGEFWLGNDVIRLLTQDQDQEVMFHLNAGNDEWAFARYLSFWIEDASQKFKLHIAGYTGGPVPGDSMIPRQHGKKFSTPDQDNDPHTADCAKKYKGGWWYGSNCHNSNLNGVYGNTQYGVGLIWTSWKGFSHSMVYTSIMVKKK